MSVAGDAQRGNSESSVSLRVCAALRGGRFAVAAAVQRVSSGGLSRWRGRGHRTQIIRVRAPGEDLK